MSKNVTPIFEADMEAALRSQYRRTKDAAVDMRMPFDQLISFEDALRLEDDGIDDADGEKTVGDYEMRQRVIGVRALFRFLLRRCGLSESAAYRPGPVSNIMLQLFATGRAMQVPFFSSMSFTENGLLFSQTKAAASNRSKLLSGVLKKAGAKGIRQPGQKTPEASASYAVSAAGNSNRKGKRQGSFLRKLAVKPAKQSPRKGASHISAKPRQQTFTRRLNVAAHTTGTKVATANSNNGGSSSPGAHRAAATTRFLGRVA